MAILLNVNTEESGLKLFAFLRRCLLNEDAELYRWIRTGQVRINSARAKSTSRVLKGDSVRVPPFANTVLPLDTIDTINTISNTVKKAEELLPWEMTSDSTSKKQDTSLEKTEEQRTINSTSEKLFSLKPIIYENNGHSITIPKIYENEHILIINKPEGLASQGGTGQSISLVEILKSTYKDSRFTPAPAHRLDKGTSGIVCIGKSYEALRFISDFMQEEIISPKNLGDTKARKEYLLWVHGNSLPINESFFMENYMFYDEKTGKMHALSSQEYHTYYTQNKQDKKYCIGHKKKHQKLNHTIDTNIKAQYALSQGVCLAKQGAYSLLKVGLFTGRKHQIRVQCQKLGMPIVGDFKYSIPSYMQKNEKYKKLKLHAFRLTLPENSKLYQRNIFETLPAWDGQFKIKLL